MVYKLRSNICSIYFLKLQFNKTGLFYAISFGHSGEVFDYLNDNENFPKIYGNGLIMTGLNTNSKFIVYTTEPNLYFSHYSLIENKKCNKLAYMYLRLELYPLAPCHIMQTSNP